MNVMLVYSNINGYHTDVYNFGLAYISSVLKTGGHNVKLEIIKSKDDYQKILKSIKVYEPAVIGFTSVSSQFPYVKKIASLIKKVHKCIIVCGGIHPTIFPECLYESDSIDGLFIGESEFSFLEFVDKIQRGDPHENNDNFYYLSNGKIIKNRLKDKLADLDELPFADREVYDYQRIIDSQHGVVTMICTRGCPFKCTYCSNHAIAKVYGQQQNSIRYRSVQNCIEEIKQIKEKYNFNSIWFIDDLFIMNRKWLIDFLDRYKESFNIPFMCNLRLDLCGREIAFALNGAGCYKVLVGVESANDYIRQEVMNRKMSKETMLNAVRWLKEAGLHILVANIIGVPKETEQTIRETIEFNKLLNPDIAAVNIFYPYSGTVLGDYCRNNNLIRKDINKEEIYERRESILKLKNISSRKLKYYYNNFSYLVFKDIDKEKAKKLKLQYLYSRLYNDGFTKYIIAALRFILHKSSLSKSCLYKKMISKIYT